MEEIRNKATAERRKSGREGMMGGGEVENHVETLDRRMQSNGRFSFTVVSDGLSIVEENEGWQRFDRQAAD